jgi:tripartite-type tricarboxylate transporter receptor subunit TctC
MKRYLFVLLAICVAVTVFAKGGAASSGLKTASGFPNRPIEVIVAYNAGGGPDLNIRTIAPSLEKILGVPIVVTNQGGGNGLPALTRIAKTTRADGYTWTIANIIATTSQSVLGDFQVDPNTEYDYLGVIVVDPGVIVAAKNGPFKNLDDVVTAAKARPSQISYGGDGLYSLDGLTKTNLESLTGIQLNFVNYPSGEGITSIMGGHMDLMGATVTEAVQSYLDGAVNIIGVGGDTRAPEIPDVPTYQEQGYQFTIQAAERAVFTPAGTDPEILKFLRDVLKMAAEDPEYIERCKQLGIRNQYIDGERTHQDVKDFMEFFRSIK